MSKPKQDPEAIHVSVGSPPDKKPPALLYFDIETTGIILLGWRLGKTQLTYDQIIKNPQVFCISWAWGEGKVQHAQYDQSKYNILKKDDDADYELLSNFVEMAQEADMVIAHNGKNFDVSFLRSRLVKYGLPDFSPILVDDTYLGTKGIDFVSHKLDYLGDYLDVGTKMEHGHGAEWWVELARGNEAILKKFLKYCDIDVRRLRSIYKKLQPYMQTMLNLAVFYERPDICPHCGCSETPHIRGYTQVGLKKLPVFRCVNCKKVITTGRNQVNMEVTKNGKKKKLAQADFPR